MKNLSNSCITISSIAIIPGSRDVMNALVKKRYANVTKQVLQLFTDMCDECSSRKRKPKSPASKKKKKSLSALAKMVMPRCQLDVVGVPMNDTVQYILSYQDLQTKYVHLKVKIIFSGHGVPQIAHLILKYKLLLFTTARGGGTLLHFTSCVQ